MDELQSWERDLVEASQDFSPCICHKGITWDVNDLNDDGTCPMNDWQNEQEEV